LSFPQAAKWALAAPLARAQEGIFEALRYDAPFTHLIVNCHENKGPVHELRDLPAPSRAWRETAMLHAAFDSEASPDLS
jgi:hypothetical protein